MARCKKEHKFDKWNPYWRFGSTVMTEEQIKNVQEKYLKEKKEAEENKKNYILFMSQIFWERRCKICKKKDSQYLYPFDKPVGKEIPVKESKSANIEKEEKYGKNLGNNEKSMSKGWKKYY